MSAASYADICSYLDTVPAASRAWADALHCAQLSMEAVQVMVETMRRDAESPLRQAEAGVLSKELMRLNAQSGAPVEGGSGGGRPRLKLNAVLSASEQVRVTRLVGGFCQPEFQDGGRFGRNGHAVMNATRRATSGYQWTKVPQDARVVEVGPDVAFWLSANPTAGGGRVGRGNYKGARPIIGPRDSVRLDWARFLASVKKREGVDEGTEVAIRVKEVLGEGGGALEYEKVESVSGTYDYILSQDSNYDIEFSSMPTTMARLGARAWLGVMVRAKGLTRVSRLTSGSLDLMGVTYRVDWNEDRIDFRHPRCTAFGYSHRATQYLRYEEHNGYVWHMDDAHYVYSKGPETSDELLFFGVYRVPKVMDLVEPRFVEHPHAQRTLIESVWGIGDEVSGVPRAFEKVRFYVDTLNFNKVLEKRRSIDHKGSLEITVSLIRSTNVRFWLNGTPVGAERKIESNLIEASAIVVELMAMEGRLNTNKVFDAAMSQFKCAVQSAPGLHVMVSSMFDMRNIAGRVVGPIARTWQKIRTTLVARAMETIDDLVVVVRPESAHLLLGGEQWEELSGVYADIDTTQGCVCASLADVREALKLCEVHERGVLREHERRLESKLPCVCVKDLDDAVRRVGEEDDSDVESVCSFHSALDGSSTAVTSVDITPSWSGADTKDLVEHKAMEEFIDLENHLARAELTECSIDAVGLIERGITDRSVMEACTTRTKHNILEFFAGRCVRRFGPQLEGIAAIYDLGTNAIIPVRTQGSVVRADVPNGYYYTCNRLKVWNGPELVASVQHAIDYGCVRPYRSSCKVVVGVPGAGKTWEMMEKNIERLSCEPNKILFLAATRKSSAQAKKYAVKFGASQKIAEARCMTIDSYLMHSKMKADVLFMDEYSMVHSGKIDAAVSISGAREVTLYGDAKQIPYDPFCADFVARHCSMQGSIDSNQVVFKPMSHRLPAKICAAWIDQYPAIYPCDCCQSDEKERAVVEWEHVPSVGDVGVSAKTRAHAYRQEERDQLKALLGMRGDVTALKEMDSGGLSTVHEDQGASHDNVHTFRLHADYDKNQSARNPSLYNRVSYVLTDMTRSRASYRYTTLSAEVDEIVKRVGMANDLERLKLVAEKRGTYQGSMAELV